MANAVLAGTDFTARRGEQIIVGSEARTEQQKVQAPEDAAANAVAYVPHVAEGINGAARNEFVCMSGDPDGSEDLLLQTSAYIHGVGTKTADIGLMAGEGAAQSRSVPSHPGGRGRPRRASRRGRSRSPSTTVPPALPEGPAGNRSARGAELAATSSRLRLRRRREVGRGGKRTSVGPAAVQM